MDTYRRRKPARRRGFITPIIALALLVVMGCMALVLDRLWLDAAVVELRTTAEASALAACRELATDDLLRESKDQDNNDRDSNAVIERINNARTAAAGIAGSNLVAGDPVTLDVTDDGDIHFGRLVFNADRGEIRFLQTNSNPTSVVVTTRRTRAGNNPVALLMRQISRQPVGDAAARAEATIDNRVIGLRALDSMPVPALPIALLRIDPAGKRKDTWNAQIEQRLGHDNFRYDADSGEVEKGSDGLPEISLSISTKGGVLEALNFQFIDLGTKLKEKGLVRQCQDGWSVDDLDSHDGELIPDADPIEVTSTGRINNATLTALRQNLGVPRIVALYDELNRVSGSGYSRIHITGFAAGRVMALHINATDELCEIVFQPAVMTTRTAVIVGENTRFLRGGGNPNRYIYKLHLTY